MRDAVAGGRLRDVVVRATPQLVENRLLEHQLARYRDLASDPEATPPVLAAPVRRGDRLRGAAHLARWLVALGDLAPDVHR